MLKGIFRALPTEGARSVPLFYDRYRLLCGFISVARWKKVVHSWRLLVITVRISTLKGTFAVEPSMENHTGGSPIGCNPFPTICCYARRLGGDIQAGLRLAARTCIAESACASALLGSQRAMSNVIMWHLHVLLTECHGLYSVTSSNAASCSIKENCSHLHTRQNPTQSQAFVTHFCDL